MPRLRSILYGVTAAIGTARGAAAQNTTNSSCSDVASACAQYAAQYGSNAVLYPTSPNYTTMNEHFWDVRSTLSPSCIFIPQTADEVATAVSILSTYGAEFAVRSGGHMNFPGSNNIDAGVLIALNALTELTVHDDDHTIDVGPGNRWVDVYAALNATGRYAIGGRMKTIGVPGLTLIGGFHYLINKYGFAMDSVVKYDVVLGNGTQVVANKATNPDLFWALKGGGNNFGIVTKFTLATYDVPKISTTVQSFSEDQVEDFITAACVMTENNPSDVGAGAIITMSYNQTTDSVSASLIGAQEGTESPPSRFANFTAIGPRNTIDAVRSPVDFHNLLDSPEQWARVQFGHKTMLPDAARTIEIYKEWRASLARIADVEGLSPTFVLNQVPAGAASVGQNNGIGNTWGLDDSQSWLIWQLSTGWSNAADDLRMTSWAKNFVESQHRLNQEMGISNEFIYMGDAGEWQNPFLGFPAENVVRLRNVRTAYDPQDTFSTLNWGGFKLGF